MLAASSLALPERATRPVFATGAMPVYAGLAVACAAIPIASAITGLRLALDEFGMVAGFFVASLWLALCLRGRGWGRAATALEACTLFAAICMTASVMTFFAGTSHRALFDAALARADRALLPGLDWPAAMRAFSTFGLPVRLANTVYASIRWQPMILLVTLAMMGDDRRVWQFLLSWITTLCIVVVLFALYPVLGAYTHFGIAAADVPAMRDATPWNQPILIEGLRDGTLRRIGVGTLDGIVDYPSFHAGAAVLLAYGFWSIRLLRWPFAVLNGLMIVSAVPIGGHYVVDLVAGVIAAMAGLGAAQLILDVTQADMPARVSRRMPRGAVPVPTSDS